MSPDRALRGGERDVAQRVPQRASQVEEQGRKGARTEQSDREAGLQGTRTGSDRCAATVSAQGTGRAYQDSKRPA